MSNNQYLQKEWLETRDRILSRDNFSCQNCATFNPSIGRVEAFDSKGNFELHEYESNPETSIYTISSQKYGITLNIDFGLDWLVLPILQVHHKRYIEGKFIWEYDDNDLVTLCKECHTLVHNEIDIPIFNNNSELINKKRFIPNDTGSGRKHNYRPWIFIKQAQQGEYIVANVSPNLRFFVFEHEDAEEMRKNAITVLEDFFKQYLPDYRKNYTPTFE